MQKIYKPNYLKILSLYSIPYLTIIIGYLLFWFPNSKGEPLPSLSLIPFFLFAFLGRTTVSLSQFPCLILSHDGIYQKFLFPQHQKIIFLYKDIHSIVLNSALALGTKAVLEITGTKSHQKKKIFLDYYPQSDELLADLQSYIAFDPQPVELAMPASTEVGKRVLYGLCAGIALFILTSWLDKTIIQGWHTSAENMLSWLFGTIPLSIGLCYLFFKGDKKNKTPFLTALLVGALLGGALNNFLVTINRYANEKNQELPMTMNFLLLEKGSHRQKWQPMDGTTLKFHDGYFHVHDSWEAGYNTHLVENKIYQIAVFKGKLNDIYFPPNAFLQAKPVN